ncbi:MAG: TetR/AcrR family transcriptional regulator [Candidatus Omnitrophica bacterium]|nr:TetR/AcrR family transcriptional regulator [Candidatus Omnitrophota bacterium]
MNKSKYSLRKKKHAKTKIALANAFIEKLKTTRFSDISIKEICQKVEVSEGTFYNYFPQKLDMISYFQNLSLLKIEWKLNQQKSKLSPLGLIELSFDLFAETIQQPYLFFEIVSVFTSQHTRPQKGNLTPAEKFYAYPEYPDIEEIKIKSLDDFFLKYLKKAKREGQINKSIDSRDMVTVLKSILVGVPLTIEINDFNNLSKIYKKQLILFKKAFLIDNQ